MQNITKFLSLILLGLVLINSVYSLSFSGDTSFSTTCSVPEMPVFKITNTSDSTQVIRIWAEGNQKDWIILGDTKIGETEYKTTLVSGESEKIYAFIKPNSCYIKEGVYYITLKIADSDRVITKELKVNVKESLSLEITAPSQVSIGQCATKNLSFRIYNDGIKDSEVKFSLDSDLIGSKEKTLEIEKGDAETFLTSVYIPCTTLAGEYEIIAKAEIEGYDYSETAKIKLNVTSSNDVSLYGTSFTTCTENPSVFIRLRNNANVSNDLQIRIDGKAKDITLDAYEYQTVQLPITSSGIGTKNYDLEIESKTFSVLDTHTIKVDFEECHSFSIEALDYSSDGYTFCKDDSVKEFSFKIRNTGKELANYSLESNAELSDNVFSLARGQSKVISGVLTNSENIQIKVDSEGLVETKELLVSVEDCYLLSVEYPSDLEIEKACDTEGYAILITNTGKRDQTVSVIGTGPDWAHIKPQEVFISAGETEKVYIYLSPGSEELSGLYTLSLEVKGESFSDNHDLKITLYGSVQEDELLLTKKTADLKTETYGTLDTEFVLENTGNGVIKIDNLEILNYSGVVSPESVVLGIGEKKTLDISVDFGTSIPNDSVVLELSFNANNEPITKNLLVSLSSDSEGLVASEIVELPTEEEVSIQETEEEGMQIEDMVIGDISSEDLPTETDEEVNTEIPITTNDSTKENISDDIKVTGAFSFAGVEKYALAVLIIVVLGIIAYFYLKDDSSEEKPKKESTNKKEEEFVKEMQEITNGEFD